DQGVDGRVGHALQAGALTHALGIGANELQREHGWYKPYQQAPSHSPSDLRRRSTMGECLPMFYNRSGPCRRRRCRRGAPSARWRDLSTNTLEGERILAAERTAMDSSRGKNGG